MMRLLPPTEPSSRRSRPTGDPEVDHAIWSGDVDWLSRHRGCSCCCYDHTFGGGCPAYVWGGCRGQGSDEEKEQIRGYAAWYREARGMTLGQFFQRPQLDDAAYDGMRYP